MSKAIYKNYTEDDAVNLAIKRYANMEGKFPYTLSRLEKDDNFKQIVLKIKEKYPDWAVYMAIVNTIINYRINNLKERPGSPQEMHEEYKKLLNRVELENEIEVPIFEFTEKSLEFAIDMFIMSFLKAQGYEFRRATPNIKKLRIFAETNYKMFDYDSPHKKWFEFE